MPRTLTTNVAILFLVLFADYAHGQNYQPMYSNSLQTFYQASTFPIAGNYIGGGNMWGTRMDSLGISLDGDTIFYNYPIYRDTAAENGSGNCIWWNAPNWNGKRTKIDTFGSSWIYNQNDDSIKIHHAAQLNEAWKAYSYPNGDSLMAQVVSVQWVDDDWVADSVKTIRFTRFSNGTPIADILDSTEIELYKNAGFRKIVDFFKFPTDTILIHRVDLNSINKYSPGYFAENEIRPMPTPGDGFYRFSIHEILNGGTVYPWSGSTYSPFSQAIMAVAPIGLNGQLLANIVSNTWSESNVLDVVFDVLPDTLFTLIQKLDGGNLMPREEGASYFYSISNLVSGNSVCLHPVVTIYYQGYYVDSDLPDTCISYQWNECWGGTEHYATYIGLIDLNTYNDNGWCDGNGDRYQFYYTYLKVGDLECGTPQMVGIDEARFDRLSIYPNPSNGIFRVEMEGEVEYRVMDALGKQIKSFTAIGPTTIDLTNHPTGIYILQMRSPNGLSSHKLVKQ